MKKGFPKRAKDGRQLFPIHVPLTDRERMTLKAAAVLKGITLGEFVRGDCVDRARRVLKHFKS